jgi:L-alanine-DL-glutamate epimerase-like enolase superfamily enzyme
MREFSISAYQRLAESVAVPLLVAETSDGAHMNSADFIKAGAATFGVRAGTTLRGGITGAMRTAHLADAYRLRAEVHGSDIPNHHLCMAIPNTTYYESLVTATTVVRERHVDENGLVHAPTGPGIALPLDYGYGPELQQFIERPAG